MMVLILATLLGFSARAQDSKLPEEKELDVVDFQNVKDVLKKDGLMQEVQRKKSEVVKIKEIRGEE
jgi:membrane carboxypeptidase/penicillin-binding protein